ncbi:MAG: hypothetical protein NZM09_07315 [Ignavibacterium sp.]|nr:hypothetical protein [Ignavibacterium sp.]MDW8375491.1 hypothetical protein [Ignavibacteriales bacterium]
MKNLKLILLVFILTFFIVSCETNPPSDPNKRDIKTGEVLIEVNLKKGIQSSYPRTVLLEDFANVSCVPCVVSNRILESLEKYSFTSSKLKIIKFATNFPSPVDPFYLVAKPFCDFRMTFYNIMFAPTIIIDGMMRPTPTDSNQIKNGINQKLQTPSNFLIELSQQKINNGLFIKIDISANNIDSTFLSNYFLRTVLVEKEIEFSSPPGSSGETKFFDVLRVMFPNNQGINLKELVGTNTFSYKNAIDTTWNIDNLKAISFIQNNSTREIAQSSNN